MSIIDKKGEHENQYPKDSAMLFVANRISVLNEPNRSTWIFFFIVILTLQKLDIVRNGATKNDPFIKNSFSAKSIFDMRMRTSIQFSLSNFSLCQNEQNRKKSQQSKTYTNKSQNGWSFSLFHYGNDFRYLITIVKFIITLLNTIIYGLCVRVCVCVAKRARSKEKKKDKTKSKGNESHPSNFHFTRTT